MLCVIMYYCAVMSGGYLLYLTCGLKLKKQERRRVAVDDAVVGGRTLQYHVSENALTNEANRGDRVELTATATAAAAAAAGAAAATERAPSGRACQRDRRASGAACPRPRLHGCDGVVTTTYSYKEPRSPTRHSATPPPSTTHRDENDHPVDLMHADDIRPTCDVMFAVW